MPIASRHGVGILAGSGNGGAGITDMLSDVQCRNAKARDLGYRLPDGGGLHLFVTPKGLKVWRLRYKIAGREKTLVIGRYPAIGLADARARREMARTSLRPGETRATNQLLMMRHHPLPSGRSETRGTR